MPRRCEEHLFDDVGEETGACPGRELVIADQREHGRDDVDTPWNFWWAVGIVEEVDKASGEQSGMSVYVVEESELIIAKRYFKRIGELQALG